MSVEEVNHCTLDMVGVMHICANSRIAGSCLSPDLPWMLWKTAEDPYIVLLIDKVGNGVLLQSFFLLFCVPPETQHGF